MIIKELTFEDRASFGRRSSRLGVSSEILALQTEYEEENFDSSLGRPLANYKEGSLALMGGKALQCWRLMNHGLPVPAAFLIPTYAYSLHLVEAGVVPLIDEVFASNLQEEAVRQAVKPKLAEIREKIMATPLNLDVVKNLSAFLGALSLEDTVAVRSSSTAEDLGSQSFAGQYDTFLYKRDPKEVVQSVKACWASMFQYHIHDYASKSVNVFSKPNMAVLVMKMVDAKAAGVVFSSNLWGDESNEIMIEAVLGQGEGLVGGEITPDRYVVNKHSNKLSYSKLSPQDHKFVRSSNEDGVEKVEIDPPFQDAVLSRKDLKEVSKAARAIENYYNRPQDIEFAIDGNGRLFVLQSRPVTTAGSVDSLSFLPPGEGLWKFDPTHNPLPMSPWFRENYGFDYAIYHGRRMGCLITSINFRFVHGFSFNQPVLSPPTPELERAAQAYWSKKLYEDDYREFNDFFRAECLALQDELRKVDPSNLSHRSLIAYVARCFDLTVEFWKLHHTYSFPCMVVVGDYMNRMSELTGRDTMETLVLLEGSSPESRGLLNREDPLLAKMYNLFAENKNAMDLLQHSDATWALDCLLHMPNELGEVMQQVCLKYGSRLVGSYDLVVPAAIETPDFFLKTIFALCKEDPNAIKMAQEHVRRKADEWKRALPPEKHDEFEEILEVGQRFFRLRDERALVSDISGVGLCRRGILEAGRRLTEAGVIYKPEHLTVTTKQEGVSLLQGGSTQASGVPTPQELERRYTHITTADPNVVPATLGTPLPTSELPVDLPPGIRRTMAALDTYLFKGMFGEGQVETDEDIIASDDTVKGLAASAGVIEAPVCMILQDGDLENAKVGDIIVARSSSSSFNAVLAVAGGIISDYGGMLSHAAIVAREYNIPSVVGSQHATKKFRNGDIVRIENGRATVVKRKN